MASFVFTSESVTEGHPDKIADQISDAILDELLRQDPVARVACESLVKTGMAVIAGEITTCGYVDMPQVVRRTIAEIGYTSSAMGFDAATCAVLSAIDKQSPDIVRGVEHAHGDDQGAGDQGMMFGYACDETPSLMPAPITYAHRMARRLSQVRKGGEVDFLRPDGKVQVSFVYIDDRPAWVDTVLVSAQHDEQVSTAQLHEAMVELVIKEVLPPSLRAPNMRMLVNPTGRFVVGGPQGDCGLTGRKIIVDTYGGTGRHGGGAFSGKDPSKVDRSAAYFARYIAKNIVAGGLATRCEVQLAYAIGVAEPVSVCVQTFGTGTVDEARIVQAVRGQFAMRPAAIIRHLDLLKPRYRATAAYGHFGQQQPSFTWEATDQAAALAARAR